MIEYSYRSAVFVHRTSDGLPPKEEPDYVAFPMCAGIFN